LATIVKDSVKPVWEQGNLHSGLLWMRPCRLQACHIFVCQRPRLSTAPTCYHVSEPNVWRLYIHVKPHLFTQCYNRIAPFSHSAHGRATSCPMAHAPRLRRSRLHRQNRTSSDGPIAEGIFAGGWGQLCE